MSGKISTGLRS